MRRRAAPHDERPPMLLRAATKGPRPTPSDAAHGAGRVDCPTYMSRIGVRLVEVVSEACGGTGAVERPADHGDSSWQHARVSVSTGVGDPPSVQHIDDVIPMSFWKATHAREATRPLPNELEVRVCTVHVGFALGVRSGRRNSSLVNFAVLGSIVDSWRCSWTFPTSTRP